MCESFEVLSFTPEGSSAYRPDDSDEPPEPVFKVDRVGDWTNEAEITVLAPAGEVEGCGDYGCTKEEFEEVTVRFRASDEVISAVIALADAIEQRRRQLAEEHRRHWQPEWDRRNAEWERQRQEYLHISRIHVRCGENREDDYWQDGLTVWDIHNRYAGCAGIRKGASWVVTDANGNALSTGDENFLVTNGMTVTFTNPTWE